MNRYKSKAAPRNATIVFRNWNGHSWEISSATQTVAWNKPIYDYVYDDPAFTFPVMQDCIRQHVRRNADVFTSNSQFDSIPDFNYTDVWLSSGHYVSVPTEYVVANSFGLRPNGILAGRLHTAQDLYATVLSRVNSESVRLQNSPFESEFSIWYLLVDLKDMPRLYQQLFRSRALIRKIRQDQILSGKTLEQLASTHLAVQFGLLPTLSDLREFAELVFKWGTMYSKLNKRLGLGLTAHPDRKSILGSQSAHYTMASHVQTADLNLSVSLNASNALMFGTMKYYFTCPELAGILNRMKQLTDVLGILDPAALWDVIPFSFLVDWFWPVGHWVHRNLKPNLFKADVIIADYCESVGRDVDISIAASWQKPDPDGPGSHQELGTTLWSGNVFQYARRRMFPQVPKIDRGGIRLNDSVITIRRFLIGTALVTQGVRGVVRGRKSPCYADRY